MNLIKIDRLQNLAQVIIKVIEKSKLKQIIDKTFSIKAQRIISNKILDLIIKHRRKITKGKCLMEEDPQKQKLRVHKVHLDIFRMIDTNSNLDCAPWMLQKYTIKS